MKSNILKKLSKLYINNKKSIVISVIICLSLVFGFLPIQSNIYMLALGLSIIAILSLLIYLVNKIHSFNEIFSILEVVNDKESDQSTPPMNSQFVQASVVDSTNQQLMYTIDYQEPYHDQYHPPKIEDDIKMQSSPRQADFNIKSLKSVNDSKDQASADYINSIITNYPLKFSND